MPIVPQTLNIKNFQIATAKPINLHTVKKLINYLLKKFYLKAMFIVTIFKILLFEGLSVLSIA